MSASSRSQSKPLSEGGSHVRVSELAASEPVPQVEAPRAITGGLSAPTADGDGPAGLTGTIERIQEQAASLNRQLLDLVQKLQTEQLGGASAVGQSQVLSRPMSVTPEDQVALSRFNQAIKPQILSSMADELDIAIHHRSLGDLGTNHYDFFRLLNERYAVGLFDTGEPGLSSLLTMALLRNQFLRVIEHFDTPQAIIEWVHRSSFDFLQHTQRTVAFTLVTFDQNKLRYVAAGGYGALARAGTRAQALTRRNHLLGFRQKPYLQAELPFPKGSILALSSSGLIDAVDGRGVEFGMHRVEECLDQNGNASSQEILDALLAKHSAHLSLSAGERETDDVTVLVLKKK